MLSGLVVLAACAGGPDDSAEDDAPFRGGVAADEPRAAQVARDVLTRGGSAADAAVALYFTLTVTRPSHAGLGAAGTCLAWDPRDEAVRAFNFKQPPSASGRPEVAQPGAPRAMQALHGLHGQQRWGQLVAPAEALARFGHRVSRTFATDLAEADPRMLASDGMRRLFVTETGRVAGEGDEIRQPELAATLGIIRTEGTTALHAGPLADRLVEGVANFGGQLDRRDLAAFTPRVSEPLVRRISSTRVAFAPWLDTQGPYQALLWDALTERDRFEDAREETRAHFAAEAAGRARGVRRHGRRCGRGRRVDERGAGGADERLCGRPAFCAGGCRRGRSPCQCGGYEFRGGR